MCFAQGVLWTLVLNGWRHWNRSAKFSGQGVGARIRRWWWGVNNWSIPKSKSRLGNSRLTKNVSEVSATFLNVGHLVPARCNSKLMHTSVLRGRVLECGSRLAIRYYCCMYRRCKNNERNSEYLQRLLGAQKLYTLLAYQIRETHILSRPLYCLECLVNLRQLEPFR